MGKHQLGKGEVMRVARMSDSHVVEFCSSLGESLPIEVVSEPQYQESENECFQLVQNKIDKFGGSLISGWAIWEKVGVFIEAEFHAVWLKSDGEYLDLNPRRNISNCRSILFVPDSNTEYKNQQINNIRKPLINDPIVNRFLHLNNKLFEFMNRGERAYQHGEIELSKREQKEYKKLIQELGRLEGKIDSKYEVKIAQ